MTDPDARPDRFAGTGLPGEPVPNGGILIVHYEDPERGGQVVSVTAHDGGDPSDRRELRVRLRGNGKGSCEFVVPVGWSSVVLTSERSAPHEVPVSRPP